MVKYRNTFPKEAPTQEIKVDVKVEDIVDVSAEEFIDNTGQWPNEFMIDPKLVTPQKLKGEYKDEIKQLAKHMKLDTTGTKREIIERILKFYWEDNGTYTD